MSKSKQNAALGKNDTAWQALFEQYNILQKIERQGAYEISADAIRQYREPRLMAKFDHRINLPQIFAQNKLAILPVTRSGYVISHFEAYHDFEPYNHTVIEKQLPGHLQSLSAENIASEAIALNCAVASGILADFLQEPELSATVSGRMGSEEFDFCIYNRQTGQDQPIKVEGSQIEIDGAFEGAESLALIEAKRDLADDFLVRQLYYPFRLWHNRVAKQVRPVFLVYSNGIFHLYEYRFQDPANYNSLELVQQKNYTLSPTQISYQQIEDLLHFTKVQPEPAIPFPQADRFDRVVNLCELLGNGGLRQEEVTQQYAFDVRQTNYYTDAARYLGLVTKEKIQGRPIYRLTPTARRLLHLPYQQRQLALVSCMLKHQVFYGACQTFLKTRQIPAKSDIIKIMKAANLYHVESESTYYRRAGTVSGWLSWVASVCSGQTRLF